MIPGIEYRTFVHINRWEKPEGNWQMKPNWPIKVVNEIGTSVATFLCAIKKRQHKKPHFLETTHAHRHRETLENQLETVNANKQAWALLLFQMCALNVLEIYWGGGGGGARAKCPSLVETCSVWRARVRLSAPLLPIDVLLKRLALLHLKRAAAAATNHHAITAFRGSCLWASSAN